MTCRLFVSPTLNFSIINCQHSKFSFETHQMFVMSFSIEKNEYIFSSILHNQPTTHPNTHTNLCWGPKACRVRKLWWNFGLNNNKAIAFYVLDSRKMKSEGSQKRINFLLVLLLPPTTTPHYHTHTQPTSPIKRTSLSLIGPSIRPLQVWATWRKCFLFVHNQQICLTDSGRENKRRTQTWNWWWGKSVQCRSHCRRKIRSLPHVGRMTNRAGEGQWSWPFGEKFVIKTIENTIGHKKWIC